MIGGIDVRMETKAGASSVEVAVRAIRQRWPRATFENALTGDTYPSFAQIPFGEIHELFVYRDAAAAAMWDAEGAVPEASNTMVHLIVDHDLLTVVVDERDAEMDVLLAAIQSGLRDQIFYVPAELERAA